jgi:hypothetical protein
MATNITAHLSAFFRWLTIGLVGWATAGALLFVMPWSIVAGLATLSLLMNWHSLPGRPRQAFAAALPFLGAAFILQVSAPEYMKTSDAIGCEVRAICGSEAAFCANTPVENYRPGQTGAVLNRREQLAVRWLNVSMAAGGALLGFEDVAYETLILMTGSTVEIRGQRASETLEDRKVWCQQALANPAREHHATGSIALESARARQLVAALAAQLEVGGAATAPLKWGNYASPDQTWATTLALWVPQSAMRVERVDEESLRTTWTGTILYPATSQLTVKLPRPIGSSYRFALDEALFCAAQLDGVFVPYKMSWTYELAPDDPILSSPQRNENAPGFLEAAIRPRSRDIGLRHAPRLRVAPDVAHDQ